MVRQADYAGISRPITSFRLGAAGFRFAIRLWDADNKG